MVLRFGVESGDAAGGAEPDGAGAGFAVRGGRRRVYPHAADRIRRRRASRHGTARARGVPGGAVVMPGAVMRADGIVAAALLLPKTSSMLVGAVVRVRPMWCAIASAGHSCDGGTLWHGDGPCCCDWPTSA